MPKKMVFFIPMTALILDTSLDRGFVALVTNKQLVHVDEIPSKQFVASIPPLLEKLNKNKLTLDYIAAGIGPGSYTGTRSGVAFANAFAFANDLPLVGFYSPLAYLPKKEGAFAYLIEGKREDICLIEGEKSLSEILSYQKPKKIPKEALLLALNHKPVTVDSKTATLNLPPLIPLLYKLFLSKEGSLDHSLTPSYLYEIDLPNPSKIPATN